MSKSKYRFKDKRLTDETILQLLTDGVYKVDLETGTVYNKHDKELTLKTGGKEEEYPYVRLYFNSHEKWIKLSRLVWMAGTKSVIPEGWEVHHRDLNPAHNWFENLFCLHKVDHGKLHRGISLIEEPEELQEIPF